MRTFNRVLRIFAAITLFFFSWTFLPLWQVAAFAAEKPQSRKTDPSQSPLGKGGGRGVGASSGERFEKALEAIRENVGKAERKHERGEDDKTERENIRAKRVEIESADSEFRKEFAATEKKLKDAKLPKEILERHYKFVKHYEDNLKELKTNLDAVGKYTADSKQGKDAIRKAKLHLEKTKTPSKHVPLDPNKLPHRMVKGKERAPRLKKEEFERDFPRQKKPAGLRSAEFAPLHSPLAKGGHGGWAKPVLLAYNSTIASDMPLELPLPSGDSVGSVPEWFNRGMRGSLDTPYWDNSLPDFVFSDSNPQSENRNPQLILAQATVALPTADDLSETPEVQFTPEIRNIAAQLGNNSLRIYEAIRNNYKYEPYYGSLKGSQQTLREKAGNDFDLASLLIALYRSAGIPARYVMTTITMPLSQAQSWLGLEDPKMIGRLLASAGIPVAVNYTSGVIRMEHVLVQAWVPYMNGRGALSGPGDTWIYMDPSYKETKLSRSLNQAISSFDQTQYLSQLRAEDPTEYHSTVIQENLNTVVPGRTVYAITQQRETIPQYFEMLLGMPQYEFVTNGTVFSQIPDQYRYKLAFELRNQNNSELSLTYQTNTIELANKRITLSYAPATAADLNLINTYGDTFSTPAYLLQLKGELKIDGTTVAQSTVAGFGSAHAFTMRFSSPRGDTEQIQNTIMSGGYYAVALDLQTVTQRMTLEHTAKLRTAIHAIAAGGTVGQDDYTGELLYSTALTYFQKLDASNKRAREIIKIVDIRDVSCAIVSIPLQVTYVLGIPKQADVAGLIIDVDRDIHLPIPVDGNLAKIKEYNMLIGSNSSYFEHNVFEDIYQFEAVSAVKALQYASSQGIQIHTITNANLNSILPTLQQADEIKADIVNAVNAGKKVTIPQTTITMTDWHGIGYIAMDPQTGEAGYIISGGFAGGSSVSIPFTAYIKASVLSQDVATATVIAAIESTLENDYVVFSGANNVLGDADDVRLKIADELLVSQVVIGPDTTQNENPSPCAFPMTGGIFSAAHWAGGGIVAPLLGLEAGAISKKVAPNLTLGNMVVSSGSNSYGRVSTGFVGALNDYIQFLHDRNIQQTIINSAYRTWYHNCQVPGAVINSQHTDGIAADVWVGPVNARFSYEYANTMFANGGVGRYSDRVHVDIRGEKKRW